MPVPFADPSKLKLLPNGRLVLVPPEPDEAPVDPSAGGVVQAEEDTAQREPAAQLNMKQVMDNYRKIKGQGDRFSAPYSTQEADLVKTDKLADPGFVKNISGTTDAAGKKNPGLGQSLDAMREYMEGQKIQRQGLLASLEGLKAQTQMPKTINTGAAADWYNSAFPERGGAMGVHTPQPEAPEKYGIDMNKLIEGTQTQAGKLSLAEAATLRALMGGTNTQQVTDTTKTGAGFKPTGNFAAMQNQFDTKYRTALTSINSSFDTGHDALQTLRSAIASGDIGQINAALSGAAVAIGKEKGKISNSDVGRMLSPQFVNGWAGLMQFIDGHPEGIKPENTADLSTLVDRGINDLLENKTRTINQTRTLYKTSTPQFWHPELDQAADSLVGGMSTATKKTMQPPPPKVPLVTREQWNAMPTKDRDAYLKTINKAPSGGVARP